MKYVLQETPVQGEDSICTPNTAVNAALMPADKKVPSLLVSL